VTSGCLSPRIHTGPATVCKRGGMEATGRWSLAFLFLPPGRVQKRDETGTGPAHAATKCNRGVRPMAVFDNYHWAAGETAMVRYDINAGPGAKGCAKTAVFQIRERDGRARLVAVPCAFREAVALERALREACAGLPACRFCPPL